MSGAGEKEVVRLKEWARARRWSKDRVLSAAGYCQLTSAANFPSGRGRNDTTSIFLSGSDVGFRFAVTFWGTGEITD